METNKKDNKILQDNTEKKTKGVQKKKEGESMPEELKSKKKVDIKEQTCATPQDEKKADPLKSKLKGLSIKNVLDAEDDTPKEVEPKSIEAEATANNHLEKMRLQRLAQKNLEKELMKKTAEKTQPKTPTLGNKMYGLEQDFQTAEKEDNEKELKELKEKVEALLSENDKYKEKVENLEKEKVSEDELNKKIELLKFENEELSKAQSASKAELESAKKANQENLLKLEEEANKKQEELVNEKNRLLSENNKLIEEKKNLEDSLSDKVKGLEKDLKTSNEKIASLEKTANEIKENNSSVELKKELTLKNKEIDKLQKDISLKDASINEKNTLIKELSNKAKNAEKTQLGKEQIQDELKNAKKQISQLQKKDQSVALEELKKTSSELKKQLSVKEKSLIKANELKDKVTLENKEIKKEVASLNKKLASKEKELEKLATIKKDNSSTTKQLVKEKEQLLKEFTELKEKLDNTIKRFNNRLEVANQGYLVAVNERIEVEERMSLALKEKQALVAKLSEELKELSVVSLEDSSLEDKDINLAEEMDQVNNEIELLKQKELIDQKREEEKKTETIEENKEVPVDESTIIDPEFEVKIRSIREMKQVILQSFEDEKKQYSKMFDDVNHRIFAKEQEIKSATKEVEKLDLEYEGTTNRTSLVREQYTAKRSKLLIGLESMKARLTALQDEHHTLTQKYNVFVSECDKKLEPINKAEMEIISHYLEKVTPTVQEEAKELVKDEVVVVESRKDLEKKARKLEQEIKALDSDYNVLDNKISILKEKQGERLESQRKVEEADEYIALYAHIRSDLDGYISYKRDLEKEFEEGQNVLAEMKNDINSRSQILKLRAKMQDNIITQDELEGKIEYSKRHLKELANNSRVKYYVALLNSMDELSVRYKQIRIKMDEIQTELTVKNAELVEIKEKLMVVE